MISSCKAISSSQSKSDGDFPGSINVRIPYWPTDSLLLPDLPCFLFLFNRCTASIDVSGKVSGMHFRETNGIYLRPHCCSSGTGMDIESEDDIPDTDRPGRLDSEPAR